MKNGTLILLMFIFFAGELFAQTEPTDTDSDGLREVSSLDHLQWISENSSGWGYDYEQTANIDASTTSSWNGGAGWSPIGSGGSFTGSYNGQEHTISGLYINNSNMYMGFFGFTQNAAISNLGIISVNISAGSSVGALAGACDNTTVTNCYSTGSIGGAQDIGGLVGASSNYSTIVNCYSSVTINGSADYLGGLVGSNGSYASISRCYSTGNVSGNNGCGGLVGRTTYTSIDNCFATGDVTGNSWIGGLIGQCYEHTTVNYCYSTGTASGSSYVGGLVGYNGTAVSIDNSFWDTEASENSSSNGGTGKTTTQMKALATFTATATEGLTIAWDFVTNPNDDSANDDYWDMDYSGTINGGYPYLNWQDGEDVSLPVELTNFKAECQSNGVLLTWRTESESENLGFIIEKRIVGANHDSPASWEQIASYTDTKSLEGQGSTSEAHEYAYTDSKVQPGVTYQYRLGDVDYSGTVTWHSAVEVMVPESDAAFPNEFGLHKAYPNPFNPCVTLSYSIKDADQTILKVYNIRGQLVETLVDTYQLNGSYTLTWQPTNLSAGVYLVRLQSGSKTNLQKVVFVK